MNKPTTTEAAAQFARQCAACIAVKEAADERR